MCVCVCVCMRAQSCLTLCGPIDCSLPGSSAHAISETKMGCHFLFQGSFPPGPHGLQVHSLPLAPPGMVVPSNFNPSYLFLVNLAYVHQKKYIRMFSIYLSKNQNQSKYPLLYKLINCYNTMEYHATMKTDKLQVKVSVCTNCRLALLSFSFLYVYVFSETYDNSEKQVY